ncbi:hypothetical protein [Acinetobacter apis]|uniref:DoxX-like family protein n=1 Tax=Acinetobacter apis TaxID=1229165 RepID=A0A217EF43_9GAMM|nr:hypothetical protein [Acinetobacter apis]SNQ28957.1 hypothetical protein SAMN05444584_0888 [Acinetobacter apis]
MKHELSIRVIYALCLTGAAFNHLKTVLMHGLFWDYHHAPIFARFFWTSLTFLDPLAVILLFLKPKAGLILTFLIIFVDVIHNTGILIYEKRDMLNSVQIAQCMFLCFVCVTIHIPWKAHQLKIING